MGAFLRRCAASSFLLLFLLRAQSTDAIPPGVDRGAAGLTRWLHAIRTRASLMMITAHPDDEDGGMLALESRGAGARAILLTLNRGEGGQNAMSPDLYDALGVVRTEELLAADRYYGVEQYWTPAVDFGFSKTREEALEKWGHDRVLENVVRVIRLTRPLVLTSVFVGAATDGHGQHQVAGEVTQEAFLAAADPARFPEQIREGLRPWKPLKIYEHVPFFDVTPQGMYDYAIDQFVPVRFFDYITKTESSTKPSTTVEIEEGDYAPPYGLTYLQIGRQGLGMQKSQNNGVAIPPPQPFASAYHRYDSRVPAPAHETGFFDGIDTSVPGIGTLLPNQPDFVKSGLAEIARLADDANAQYRPDRPDTIAPLLAHGLSDTRALLAKVAGSDLPDPGKSDVAFELRAKESQFENALAAALGISLQAAVAPPASRAPNPFAAVSPTFGIAIPGQSFAVQVDVRNQSPEAVHLDAAKVEASDGKAWRISPPAGIAKSLSPGEQSRLRFEIAAPADAALTRPYFTRQDEEQSYYNLTDERDRNLSLAPYPLAADIQISYRGVALHLSEVVQAMQRVQAEGIVAQPLLMGPAISVTLSAAAGALPIGTTSFRFACTVHSNVKGPAHGTLRLRLPDGWRAKPEAAPFSMERDGEDHTIAFSVEPGNLTPGDHLITAVAEYQGKTYQEGYRLVGYAGLRPYPLYRPATYRAVGVDVKTARDLHIGYFPGTGDEVPQALAELGLSVQDLAASDVQQGDLSAFDAIILGTRAYAVRPELKLANSRLLDYVKNGGVLIVQYNLQDFDQNYGPYPFKLGSNPQKVVDERSRVTLLEPRSPLFTWPNRITEKDFDGWVEERGHGFMQSWDSRYQALTGTADPGQDPQRGGLLVARSGKGAYIYDAFALYRQLASGVPGAFRILANLVSLGQNPQWISAK